MQVTIDGVPYAPASVASSRIGIAITTHNRADVLKRAIEQHQKHLPAGALVVVIDDGSKPAAVVPDGVQLLRNETSLGIVASKNYAIQTQRYSTSNSIPASLTALSRRSPASPAAALSAFRIPTTLKPALIAVHGPVRLSGHGRITLRGFFTIWLFLTGSASGTV